MRSAGSDSAQGQGLPFALKELRHTARALLTDLIASVPRAVGAARHVTESVILGICTTALGNDFDEWDHISQAGRLTDTGRILVSVFDDDTIIPAGTHTVRIHSYPAAEHRRFWRRPFQRNVQRLFVKVVGAGHPFAVIESVLLRRNLPP